MKTFAKISTLFLIALTFFFAASAAKAGNTDIPSAKTIAMKLSGATHTTVGNAVTAVVTANHDTEARITVQNADGKTFATQSLDVSEGRNLVKFNISEIPSGIYFVKLTADGATQTSTFVVNP